MAQEIQNLPAMQTVGWVKINAKPLRTALATWASKWVEGPLGALHARLSLR